MGRWTLGEIRDRSGDSLRGPERVRVPPGGPGWVGEPSGMFGTGWRTLREVQDGLGTLLKVRDGLGDPRGGPGHVGVP